MDCVVYHRISCIALRLFRNGKERAGKAYRYSNDMTFAASSLAHLPGFQLIIVEPHEQGQIKTAICRLKGRVKRATTEWVPQSFDINTHRRPSRAIDAGFSVVQILHLKLKSPSTPKCSETRMGQCPILVSEHSGVDGQLFARLI